MAMLPRFSLRTYALLLTLALPALSWADGGMVLLDRAVLVVGDPAGIPQVITASDIRLIEALAVRDPSPVLAIRAREATPQEMAIDRAILLQAAGEVRIYHPDDAEVRERADAILAGFSDPDAAALWMTELGLDEDRLRATMFTRMLVERYVARALARQQTIEVGGYVPWITEIRSRTPVIRPELRTD
jgi:hypothetical protein